MIICGGQITINVREIVNFGHLKRAEVDLFDVIYFLFMAHFLLHTLV